MIGVGLQRAARRRPVTYAALGLHQTNALWQIYLAIKAFRAKHKQPHICGQSSAWRVTRITGPLFSGEARAQVGGREAQVRPYGPSS